MRKIEAIWAAGPVIPVLTVAHAADAAPLARALAAGGVRVAELTLRTPAALEALSLMRAAAPDLVVGMGTILEPGQAHASIAAGAQFLVSPGLTDELIRCFQGVDTPVLPGVATVSEAMVARCAGFSALKFFPAEAAGGTQYLAALAGPLPDLAFCPTGGISLKTARDYLALENVVCVGSSWIAPANLIAAGDFAGIEERARAAAALGMA
jgi:2-dehydro-3-deoxyphosphogluconate aldolase/(4S)-4-hydroxy-2-oxoglutarate aldolase